MKNIKTLLIIEIILLLSGCGSWSDIQNEYGGLLKQNPSCTYSNSQDTYANNLGVTKFTIFANQSGLYIQNDGESQKTIFSEAENNMNSLELGYTSFSISENFIKGILNSYDGKKYKCPGTVYVNTQSGISTFMNDDCEGMDGMCTKYYLGERQSVTIDGNKQRDCHLPGENVSYCIKFQKTDIYNYEMGWYTSNDGSKKRYFGVATNNVYSDIVTKKEDDSDVGSNGEFKVYLNRSYFTITREAINEIWDKEDHVIDKGNIKVSNNPTTADQYFITGPNSTNYGFIEDPTEAVDNPDKDPVYELSKITKEELEKLQINQIDLCTKGSGGLKVMQIVGYILYIMKILVPLILIIMASVDLAKGVISSGEKPNAEVLKKLAARIIIGVIIFIIPTVLDFLLSLVDGTEGVMDNNGKFTKCTDCLLDPFGDCTK